MPISRDLSWPRILVADPVEAKDKCGVYRCFFSNRKALLHSAQRTGTA
jgi:hypothetical protein